MGNLIGEGFSAGVGIANAKKAQKRAAKNAEQQNDLIKSLDWTPTTTAELAPTYQRSQSPVARSYLESFLLGSNPDSVMPGDPMAAQKKRQMQYTQNQQFGTPEQRVAQQNAYRATTPWAIDTKAVGADQAARKEQQDAAMFQSEQPAYAEAGLDRDAFDALVKRGAIDPKTQVFDVKKLAQNQDVVQSLAKQGDWDALTVLFNPMKAKDARKRLAYDGANAWDVTDDYVLEREKERLSETGGTARARRKAAR